MYGWAAAAEGSDRTTTPNANSAKRVAYPIMKLSL
jgi:hypothetical protein